MILYYDPIKWLGDNVTDEYTFMTMPVTNRIESVGTLEHVMIGTSRKVEDVAKMFE